MLTAVDVGVCLVTLAAVMGVGLVAARGERTAEDYFLAGRDARWWGVAGSIFGSNVSANHLVGMLGIGYSIGFAQSHFELGAIAALFLLAYGFLPVYRKLGVFTLSDYLGRRYDDRSQLLYAVIVLLVVLVKLTGAFYIGARSLSALLADGPLAIGYGSGIVVLALVTATYTIVGGLKAVMFTDVLQSLLLLLAGLIVAGLTFATPEVGGWAGMMAQDAALPRPDQKMHLYLPSDHPQLPWSGALSGLLVLHAFYWSTNQFIVQRALAARSDAEARVGILGAGFLKLTIPFFAIGGGVAAAHLFEARLAGQSIDPDAAMPVLMKLVIPAGYGLFGLVVAGLIGAILSSIDSMVNSAATLITFDLYRKLVRPDAADAELVPVGKAVIAVLIAVAAGLALWTYAPDSSDNFFLRMASEAGHFTPGLVVVFALGMFWRGAHAHGAVAAIVAGPLFSFALEWAYGAYLAPVSEALTATLGTSLNFLHRVMATTAACAAVQVAVSLRCRPDPEGRRYTYAAVLGTGRPVRPLVYGLGGLVVGLVALGVAVRQQVLAPGSAAWLASLIAFVPFVPYLGRSDRAVGWLRDDRVWAALLAATTLHVMFRYF